MKKDRVKWVILIMLPALSLLVGCEKLPEVLRFDRYFAPQEKAEKAVSKQPVAKKVVPVAKGPVLARVNDRIITLDEFNETFDALPQEIKDAYLESPQGKMGFLYELVDRELLIEEALNRKLDRAQEVTKLMEDFKDQVLYNKILSMEVEKIKATPKEIKDYYNSFKAEFTQPEEREVSVIILPNEADARTVLIQLLEGGDFAVLAREKSIGPNKSNGGKMGFIVKKTAFTPADKKTVFPKFEEVAFSLDSGATSNIFKGPQGYYIVKVDKIKAPIQQTLSERRDDIEKVLLLTKQRQVLIGLLNRLRGEAKPYEVHEDLLTD